MVHLTFAIGQFFAILLGAILRAVGTAVAVGICALIVPLLVIVVMRAVAHRRRR